jgi:hypothetical protein
VPVCFYLRLVVDDLSVVPLGVGGEELPHLVKALVLLGRVSELLVSVPALEDRGYRT